MVIVLPAELVVVMRPAPAPPEVLLPLEVELLEPAPPVAFPVPEG